MYALNYFDYYYFPFFPFGLKYYDFFDFPIFKPGINRKSDFVLNKTFKRVFDKLESIGDLDSALDGDDEDDLV